MSKQEIMNIDLSNVLEGYYYVTFGHSSSNCLQEYMNELGKLQYKYYYSFSNSAINLSKKLFDKPGFKDTYLRLGKDSKYYLDTCYNIFPINFVDQLKYCRLGEFVAYSI